MALLLGIAGPIAGGVEASDGRLGAPQARRGGEEREQLVFNDRVEPHWFDGGRRFWYRNDLPEGRKEFVLVDAESGTRGPAFDHAELAGALSGVSGQPADAARLRFDVIGFNDSGTGVRFEAAGKTWEFGLESGECTEATRSVGEADAGEDGRRGRRRPGDGGPRRRPADEPLEAPGGGASAWLEDSNVFIAVGGGDGRAATDDGEEGNAYRLLEWAPDGGAAVAWRVEAGERKEVHLVESSPEGGGRARISSRPYALPGDRFDRYRLTLFPITTGDSGGGGAGAGASLVRPEVDPVELEWGRPQVHWHRDGRHFSYAHADRGHQRFRVTRVDSHTGEAATVVDETTDTFIWTAHAENLQLQKVNWLGQTDEIIYASERSGWRHLYLADASGDAGGELKPITSGAWVVRGIDRIDEVARQVWFTASGFYPGQDPYFLHSFRVGFDGTGLVALTEGDGTHSVEFSPDRRFLIDTYSRVDRAPVTELRRASDGKLVCKLEEADISRLLESGWQPPEVFVAKGRDGETDIWGIISRPPGFDPGERYPVVEQVYAGPQSAYVPKRFSSRSRFSDLTDLGFIVVQADGMGTAHRSKAFHDVCWHDLKDAGFPDRIRWHQAVAAKYPYYDLARVGIYGVSAGGQNAAGAVLFHPGFYRAAVAGSGCHDNRMDKASWNEQWMGYPVGPQYSESSNIDNAHRLDGKLLLIVGELDRNVPPESTMRFVDALVKADKDFEMLVVPGAGHGIGGSYGRRRMREFFVRHLAPGPVAPAGGGAAE